MKVLVFIPTLNAQKFISRQIDMLRKQTIKPDIFVVDSGSTDKTLEILREKHINYKIISKNNFNHGLTRNEVLKFDKYKYYLFLTQDAIPCDEFLVENMLKMFEEKVKIVYARHIPYDFSDEIEYFSREFNYPVNTFIKSLDDVNKLGIKTFFTSNSCCMYEANYFRFKKGFKKVNVSEDMEFAYRCIMDGYFIGYAANAKVCHSHLYNFKEIYNRYFEIGRFFCMHPYLNKYMNMGEGISQVKYVLKKLFKKKSYLLILKFIVQVMIKYIAFNRGKKSC